MQKVKVDDIEIPSFLKLIPISESFIKIKARRKKDHVYVGLDPEKHMQ